MIIKKKWLILSFLAILLSTSFLQGNIGYSNDYNKKFMGNSEPFLSDIIVGSYTVPGISESVPVDRIVKIGLLDDMNHFTGDHAWKGALLAAREVNEEGGILINGNNYYVGLVAENTNEVYGTVTKGIEAAENIINNHHPHFITGGYSDFLYQYLDVVMDNKIPFLGTAAAGMELCQNVLDDYERYKYFFRVMPINFGSLVTDLVSYLIYLGYYLNSIDAGIVNKTAIIRDENFAFDGIANAIKSFLPTFGISVLNDTIVPFDATATDFINYWNQIESTGVQVVCSMFGDSPHFGKLMAQTYKQLQPQCLIVSYSHFGQLNTDWDYVEGACQFEIVLQGIYNTSKTPLTIPFFTRYVNEYDIEPLYTGAGSYDAVKLLVQTVNKTQTFDPDVTVSALEKINSTNPYAGAGGYGAFTPSHDLKYGWPFGYSLFCQFKYIDGTKEVVPHKTFLPVAPAGYPDSIATGSLRLPYWGLNGLLTNPPQPPRNFTMSSTAGTPDYDGKFNLTWTDSEGADNYSIYMSDNPFTYISKKFDLLAYQTASPPFQMSLKKGDYYFRVVAYNETGETMSSNDFHVNIPGPGPFLLTDNAVKPTDTDGNFDLIWTDSLRANNYSVYRHISKITTINDSLTLFANQTAQSPFSLTGLTNGKYYFAVAAYNEMGYTLSNNVCIVVQLPFDMTVIFIVSISSVVGVASIVLVKKYPKLKSKLKKRKNEHKLEKRKNEHKLKK